MASQIARSREAFFKPFRAPKSRVRTELARESDKRKTEKVLYGEKRKAYLDTHTFCEFEGCSRLATEIHHRARRGANYLDENTFFAICRGHHRFLHDNPKAAKELGLLT